MSPDEIFQYKCVAATLALYTVQCKVHMVKNAINLQIPVSTKEIPNILAQFMNIDIPFSSYP